LSELRLGPARLPVSPYGVSSNSAGNTRLRAEMRAARGTNDNRQGGVSLRKSAKVSWARVDKVKTQAFAFHD